MRAITGRRGANKFVAKIKLPKIPADIERRDLLPAVQQISDEPGNLLLPRHRLQQIPSPDHAPEHEIRDDEGARPAKRTRQGG